VEERLRLDRVDVSMCCALLGGEHGGWYVPEIRGFELEYVAASSHLRLKSPLWLESDHGTIWWCWLAMSLRRSGTPSAREQASSLLAREVAAAYGNS
jgi:hypothetical protein